MNQDNILTWDQKMPRVQRYCWLIEVNIGCVGVPNFITSLVSCFTCPGIIGYKVNLMLIILL